MVFFRVAAAVDFLADLLVAAAPVVVLASRVAISGFAPHTTRLVVVGQWGGAGGAGCEEHCIDGDCVRRAGVICVRACLGEVNFQFVHLSTRVFHAGFFI